VFSLLGLPVSFGLGAAAGAVPWFGLATGVLLTLAGLAAFAGRHLTVRLPARLPVRRERRVGAMLLFGAGYGAASLGCTLPVFLTLIGTSLGTAKLTAFLAYGAGMAVVLMALAVAVALARTAVAGPLRQLLPYSNRLAAVLLTLSGAYLAYYWARIRFGNPVTLANDPVVGFASRYSGQLENAAQQHGTPVLAAAAAIVVIALASGLRRWIHLPVSSPQRDEARR
jgi:cytochrome c-type biogenesis protein